MMTFEDQNYEFNAGYDYRLGMYSALDPNSEARSDEAAAEKEWQQLTPAERFTRIARFERVMLKQAGVSNCEGECPF